MAKTVRKVRRRVRLVSLTPLALWSWKYRHELAGALQMAKRMPKQALAGGAKDLVTEARVRQALARDPLTRGNRKVQIVDVHDGEVRLRAATASAGAAARSVAERVPGVKQVSMTPTSSTAPTPTTWTTPLTPPPDTSATSANASSH